MSLKQEIETWVGALEYYDKQDYDSALKTFDGIAETSRILFNCGVIHATLGEHDKAVEKYQKAIALDKYLAVAYFQQGVSNFLIGDFEEALANFNDTLLYLRGHRFIDYDQLGLKFKLYSCEALFNRGLCYIYLNARDNGMNDLIFAAKEKEIPDHDVIDEAIKENAEGYTVFSIPVGVVYRPNASKVKNLKTKDYLGKARLIASADKANVHTNFAGAEKKQAEMAAAKANEERDADKVSYAASSLVRNDIVSRARQQSEPPVNRNNLFPPTPPPEDAARFNSGSSARSIAPSESASLTSRANSIRSGAAPYRLNTKMAMRNAPPLPEMDNGMMVPTPQTMPAATFDQRGQADESADMVSPLGRGPSQKPRMGTIRTGSEPPRRNNNFDDTMSFARGRGRDEDLMSPRSQAAQRQRLYGEVMDDPHDADDEEYQDDLYDLYSQTASANPYGQPQRERSTATVKGRADRDASQTRRPPPREVTSMYPPSEDDVPSGNSSLEDFEMLNAAMNNSRLVPAALQTGASQHRRNQSEQASTVSRAPTAASHTRQGSYAPPSTYMAYGNTGNAGNGPMGANSVNSANSANSEEVQKIRVKLHHADESRYLMVNAMTRFDDFESKAKDKLKLRGACKIKMRDEEDPTELITVGDADDWDMALESCRKEARGKGDEMGRLEVWISEA